MDTDKNNKEKAGETVFQQVFFMSTPVVVYGYYEKPLTTLTTLLRRASTVGTRGVYFNSSMKKGESKGNIVESCLWSFCQRG